MLQYLIRQSQSQLSKKISSKYPLITNYQQITQRQSVPLPQILPQQEYKVPSYTPLTIPRPIKPKYKTCRAQLTRVPMTIKKLLRTTKTLKKMPLQQVIDTLKKDIRKSAFYVQKAINASIKNAKLLKMNTNHLYIKDIILGRQFRRKSVYYKAKGQGALQIHDQTKIRIVLQEKNPKDIYRNVLLGNREYGYNKKIVVELNKEHDYKLLQNSPFLTSRGRQQMKLMLKRKAQQKLKEYQELGIQINLKAIMIRIVEEESMKIDLQQTSKQDIDLEKRRRHYMSQQ